MLEVPLFPGLPGGRWARLGPLTGAIEGDFDPEDPGAFGRLVDRLLEPCEGTAVGPGHAMKLAITDLDRIAVALYRRHFGNRVESRVPCGRCGLEFEVALDLDTMTPEPTDKSAEDVTGPDSDGRFRLEDGPSFRLPTLQDQLATRHLEPEEARRKLLERCTKGAAVDEETAASIEAAMEAAGPLVSGRVRAPCPHCHFDQAEFVFAIQQLFVDAVAFERRFLYHEIHYMARAYGWSRSEILTLPKDDRRRHVRMVMEERAAG